MLRHLVLDTNVLLLLIIGVAHKSYIAVHKNTDTYDVEDFAILRRLVDASAGLVVSQAVLAETSNLMRQFKEPGRSQISRVFQRLVLNGKEIQIGSIEVVEYAEFLRLGFTDSILLTMGAEGLVFLTDDLNAYQAACTSGRYFETWNFTHIRAAERKF